MKTKYVEKKVESQLEKLPEEIIFIPAFVRTELKTFIERSRFSKGMVKRVNALTQSLTFAE